MRLDKKPPEQRREEIFCMHRMFVIAYVMLTILCFGYMMQRSEAYTFLEMLEHNISMVLFYIEVLILIGTLHFVTIFNIKLDLFED